MHQERHCVAVDRRHQPWRMDTLLRSRRRPLVIAAPIVVILSCIPAFSASGSAAVVTVQSAKATCKQLPKSQIQALLAVPIAKVKVTSALQTGQQCVYTGGGSGGDGDVIDVLVIKGPEAKQGIQEDMKSLSPRVSVKGVGDRAYREKGDYQIDSIAGSEYCSVSVGSEDSVKGVDALLVNGSSDLPEAANAIIASALGTICNRLYGKGNTKPSLQGLSALSPATTGS
jgi:hypothetical protein